MYKEARLSGLRIQLLGGLRIISDGAPLSIAASSRVQALIAYLALNGRGPVSRRQLAFAFWPDSNEPQARTNLRQLLHHLRAAWPDAPRYLANDAQALTWREGAHLSVDVEEFEAAIARANQGSRRNDHAAVREALEDAARLYRGDLLPGMYDEWAEEKRALLKKEYAGVLERLAQLYEQAGEYPAAIRTADRLLAEDPLRETLYQDLMRLYALTGDRAAALGAFHRCATNLRRELGVEPSPATRRIRDQVATIVFEAPSFASASPTVSESRMIGRDKEWAELSSAWSIAAAGRASFVLLTGEAGIGKTRLVEELLAHAARQGASTARAACYLADRPVPYAPVTEWLRRPVFQAVLEGLSPPVLSQLARVVPGILFDRPGVSPPPPFTERWQRRHFFEALARALLAAPPPLLLAIDDIQYCDTDTIEWIEYLVRLEPASPVLVLGAARVDEIDERHPAAMMLRDLRRCEQGIEIALGPLSAEETASLAKRASARELDPESTRLLYQQTRGNPLFVIEMARAGVARGEPLPPKVHAVITGRLAQLSEPARELAAAAAAVGRPFTLRLLAEATGSEDDRIAGALDELWQRGIVRANTDDSYDFAHGLIAEVAYNQTGPERRRILHRRIAGALVALYGANLDAVASLIAEQYERGGLRWEAVPHLERAAALMRRRYAEEEAITYLERALRLLKEGPPGEERDRIELRLLASLGQSFIATRGYASPEVGQTYSRARLLAEIHSDQQHRFAVLSGSWIFHVVRGELEAARLVAARCAELGAQSGDDTLAVAGSLPLGSSLFHLGQVREARECFETVVRQLRSETNSRLFFEFGPELGVFAQSYLAHALWLLGFPDESRDASRQSLLRAESLSHPFSTAFALAYDAMLHQFRGEPDAACEQAEQAAAICLKYGFRYYLSWTPIIRGWAQARKGAPAEGLAQMEEGYAALRATGAWLRAPYYLGLMADALRAMGRAGESARLIAEAWAVARRNSEQWISPELARLEGDMLLDRGDEREAEIQYRHALQFAETRSLQIFALRSAMSLCRLARAGAPRAARIAQLRTILSQIDSKCETPDILEGRSLLADASAAKNAS